MENPSFEDVFPIGKGEFPASYVSLPEGNFQKDVLLPKKDKLSVNSRTTNPLSALIINSFVSRVGSPNHWNDPSILIVNVIFWFGSSLLQNTSLGKFEVNA